MKHWDHHRILKLFLPCLWVVSLFFVIGGTRDVFAKDFFVAVSNGNDANAGTQQAPFRTLDRVFNILLPGDTLYVREGTYSGSNSMVNLPSGNSWSQPVLIKAYQQEKVVFTAQSGRTLLNFKNRSQYIIIDGIIFDAKGGHHAIQSGIGSHHIRIMNGEVMNAPEQGILTVQDSAYFEFINLRVHHNGTSDYAHGFYIATDHHLVKDCVIYQNSGWGVHIYSGDSYKPDNNLIINNRIYDNNRMGNWGAGIGIYSGTGNQAINNIIWGSGQDGIIAHFGAKNSMIFNNTLFANKTGILIEAGATGTQAINNISYNNADRNIHNAGVSTTVSHNLVVDPLFVDAATKNFRLKTGSPAINAGLILVEVTTDFDNNLRPTNANYDIGAFQKSANSLAPPSALRVLKP